MYNVQPVNKNETEKNVYFFLLTNKKISYPPLNESLTWPPIQVKNSSLVSKWILESIYLKISRISLHLTVLYISNLNPGGRFISRYPGYLCIYLFCIYIYLTFEMNPGGRSIHDIQDISASNCSVCIDWADSICRIARSPEEYPAATSLPSGLQLDNIRISDSVQW